MLFLSHPCHGSNLSENYVVDDLHLEVATLDVYS